MTIDQVKFEFSRARKTPPRLIDTEKVKKQRELFDMICFQNHMTPAQLGETPIDRVAGMLKAIDPKFVMGSQFAGKVAAYVKAAGSISPGDSSPPLASR